MIDLTALRALAQTAATQLGSLHGDPSKNANWMRERQLAMYLLTLIDRIEVVSAPMEAAMIDLAALRGSSYVPRTTLLKLLDDTERLRAELERLRDVAGNAADWLETNTDGESRRFHAERIRHEAAVGRSEGTP